MVFSSLLFWGVLPLGCALVGGFVGAAIRHRSRGR